MIVKLHQSEMRERCQGLPIGFWHGMWCSLLGQAVLEEKKVAGGQDDDFSFEHVEFEMPLRDPSGNVLDLNMWSACEPLKQSVGKWSCRNG